MATPSNCTCSFPDDTWSEYRLDPSGQFPGECSAYWEPCSSVGAGRVITPQFVRKWEAGRILRARLPFRYRTHFCNPYRCIMSSRGLAGPSVLNREKGMGDSACLAALVFFFSGSLPPFRPL